MGNNEPWDGLVVMGEAVKSLGANVKECDYLH
jgi:hypothetical protein